MNIFETFETYLKEPLSILKRNLIQIVNIQTDNIFTHKPSCNVSLMKDGAQITVVNNDKMYHFLSLVTHKIDLRQKEENKEGLLK